MYFKIEGKTIVLAYVLLLENFIAFLFRRTLPHQNQLMSKYFNTKKIKENQIDCALLLFHEKKTYFK